MLFLAMVSAIYLNLQQLDVKTIFVHGKLEDKVYMSQPKGFVDTKKDHVFLLKKYLYGLK